MIHDVWVVTELARMGMASGKEYGAKGAYTYLRVLSVRHN